jgi:hypothetical protein
MDWTQENKGNWIVVVPLRFGYRSTAFGEAERWRAMVSDAVMIQMDREQGNDTGWIIISPESYRACQRGWRWSRVTTWSTAGVREDADAGLESGLPHLIPLA